MTHPDKADTASLPETVVKSKPLARTVQERTDKSVKFAGSESREDFNNKRNREDRQPTIQSEFGRKGGRIEGREGWKTLQTRGKGRFGTVVEKSRSSVKAEAELFFPFSLLAEHVVGLRCGQALDAASVSSLYFARAVVGGRACAAC
uniref:Uncharacterized protein n=1 Tax=Timema poppense TaxID=170557 RepID=A0A7R9GWB7_TIMPO|nr:unnamed protein product [Timema poppensis]